jgi:Xaa-Pro aminopeptidase
MPRIQKINNEVYKKRRNTLISRIKKEYADKKDGVVLLFANFETERLVFRQESSFYYLTGITEPASALMIDTKNDHSTFYVPNFGAVREKWVDIAIGVGKKQEVAFGFNDIAYLGEPCTGYQCHPFFTQNEYAHLLTIIQKCVEEKRTIFTFNPQNKDAYIEQRFILQRIGTLIPGFKELLVDISPTIAQMRCVKSQEEFELLYKAIDITIDSHIAVAQSIKSGMVEYELQALIEYMFVSLGGSVAFPSIVASGNKSTVLHYHENNKEVKEGELVVIDIGAEYNYYCADVTRTYPVSGTFTDRQREIYQIVLDTQEYIAGIAQPGYWISNKQEKSKSLHHLAQEYLLEKGYDKYFTHGIGHYLGIDVHDVGDYSKPLEPGNVITIEPGIYIPEEHIGVRIEDNYWIGQEGSICLSEELPKEPDQIEALMQPQSELAI